MLFKLPGKRNYRKTSLLQVRVKVADGFAS